MGTIFVDGGLGGLSVTYGLLKAGKEVIVLDGSDNDVPASHGDFELV